MLNTLILFVTVAMAGVLLYPKLAKATIWRASITPLASIIGSGFLVLGPILGVSYGVYAPLLMAVLCAGAYLFGSVIRFNIATIDGTKGKRSALQEHLETAASWVLAFAYVISVAYYLNLFGAFGVSLTELDSKLHAKQLTSAVLLLILIVGWTRGFGALERMEQVTVGIKLAIISGLLFGLAAYFFGKVGSGELLRNPPTVTGWAAVTLAFGLIVTVQGFETSRYLGEHYDAKTRIRSMRIAQGLSTIIYMTYIGFMAYVFEPGKLSLDETAIIPMMKIVAPILPVLLVAAALSAQFSAAIADTNGSGGLVEELTGGRVSSKQAYAILVAIGLILTWTTNIFQIIAYASRAFALYYSIQSLIAAIAAWQRPDRRIHAVGFGMLCILGWMIVIFGAPIE